MGSGESYGHRRNEKHMAALFDPKKNQIAAFQKSIEDNSRLIGQLFDEIGKLYYRQYRDMNADVSRDINARCGK